MLTPHCSAASGIVVPPSIVSTTRLRKSAEYGFAIHAGLLPADSLNHIRAAMGIPDSAFPGNALTANWCIVSLVMGESMENLTGSGMDTASANANQGLNDFRKSLSRLPRLIHQY